jgi:hypothetical protein
MYRFDFGKHRGRLASDVPTGYLRWCVTTCDCLQPWFRLAIRAELERKAERRQAGLTDPFEEHRKRPLLCARCRGRGETKAGEPCDCPEGSHRSDFRRFLETKGNTPEHSRQTCRRAAAALDGCKAVFLADISPSRVIDWLAGEREAGRLSIQTRNYYLRDLK